MPPVTAEPAPDLFDAFAGLAAVDLRAADLDGVLATLAALAARSVPGATGVSVTLSRGGRASTVVFSGEPARVLDETQYDLGAGPCLRAFESGDVVVVEDMGAERRWPVFASHAIEAGCRSAMSIGFPGHEWAAGALNVFAAETGAFDDYAITVARAVAGHAVVAVANARLSATQAALAERLGVVLASGDVAPPADGGA